jgi:transcriptional regulator with XRE-family HTH domain/tetratricopeptide (TPR) repeat protein
MNSTNSKTPNNRLRRERELRGWSQSKVASEIGTNTDRISRWESGDSAVSPYYREKLCTLFGKNAAELGLIEDTGSGTAKEPLPTQTISSINLDGHQPIQLFLPQSIPHVVTIQIQQQTQTRSDVHSDSSDIIQSGRLNHSEISTESDIDMNPGRRNATKLLAAAAGSSLLSRFNLLNHDALDQLSAIMKKSSNIDKRAVNSLGIITESHWELVYGGVPKKDLIFSVHGHLQSIIHFLQSSPLTSIEQHLCVIASQQAQIMNEIYFDMHDYQKAEVYSKFAIEAAQRANNPALYAVALARMSFLYTYNHQFKEALSFLQVARRYAEQSTEITICCWIAAMEAEVQANIFAHYNDVQAFNACSEALDRARRIIEQTGDDAYWTKFGPASLAGYKGVCFKQLRKPVEAQIVILNALDTINKDVPGGQATMLTDLAAAYAQQGEIEEACNRASQALTIIDNQTKSVNALQRVLDFRPSLKQWVSTSHVRDLDEQIAITRIHIA